jgi:hypothetical protein
MSGGDEERRFIGRRGLVKRLALMEGEPGRSIYAAGVRRFERADETLSVVPPFGLAETRTYDRIRVAPLVEDLQRDRLVAVLLVRLGGYVAGVLDGERVVASKTGRGSSRGATRRAGRPPTASGGGARSRRASWSGTPPTWPWRCSTHGSTRSRRSPWAEIGPPSARRSTRAPS